MDYHGFRDDLIETISRLVMYKNQTAKGVQFPDTEGWLKLYMGESYQEGYAVDYIKINVFRAEVDNTVGAILKSLNERESEAKRYY